MLDLLTLKQEILDNNYRHLYIFSGNEVGVKDVYTDKIISISNTTKQIYPSFAHICPVLNEMTLDDKTYCYVITNDTDLITDERAWGRLNEEISTTKHIVILKYTNIDKRSRFYKYFQDDITEFEHLNEDILIKHIRQKIDLTEYNCEQLIKMCNSDYARILLEVDKIKRIDNIPDRGFKRLLDEHCIYREPKDAVFDFVNSLLKGNVNQALDFLHQARECGNNTFAILTILYNTAKQVLQVQSCPTNDVCKTTGLTTWQVRCVQDKLNVFGNGDLVYLMKLITKTLEDIKNGFIDERIAIEYIICKFM